MLKQPKERIVDQYSDKSGKELVKIASQLKDEKLAKLAIDTLFSMERPYQEDASFPSATPKDAFLSRIYFEGQREKIASERAEEIDKRLCIDEELHSLPNHVAFKPKLEKTACGVSVPLLPLCKIASKSELFQAGEDFSRDFEKLSSKDRKVFSRNFVKIATAWNMNIPDDVRIYACEGVEGRTDILDNILLRKVAMEGRGLTNSGFDQLYDNLHKIDISELTNSQLYKLAQTLDEADEYYEIRETLRGRTIPDAWHSVFQVKQAEQAAPRVDVDSMSKAEIVSRYGEGALEEVEDGEGEIDREKLRNLIIAFGGGKDSSSENTSSSDANADSSVELK